MTHELYERLMQDGERVPGYFANALKIWAEIWAKAGRSVTASALAPILRSAQAEFETKCGGRSLGQEIMALTAIAQFYSCASGFDQDGIKRARITRDAMRTSGCSGEVVGMVDRHAKAYAIDERQPSES